MRWGGNRKENNAWVVVWRAVEKTVTAEKAVGMYGTMCVVTIRVGDERLHEIKDIIAIGRGVPTGGGTVTVVVVSMASGMEINSL